MARTLKQGIDYFPLDVQMDEKVELLEAKYGIEGFAIYIKLLQRIYSNSYFLDWNEEKLLLFKKSINVDINLINAIINDCLCWQLFDKCMFERYSILTSRGVQLRYIEATQRRKEVEFIWEYLLVDNVASKYGEKINVNINRLNVDINSQKKREEKKREEKRDNTACVHTREEISLTEKYPNLNIDCEIPKDFDYEKVEIALTESDYLKNCVSLQWVVDNYEKVISGYYKSFNKPKSLNCGRNYSSKDLKELIPSIDEIRI